MKQLDLFSEDLTQSPSKIHRALFARMRELEANIEILDTQVSILTLQLAEIEGQKPDTFSLCEVAH